MSLRTKKKKKQTKNKQYSKVCLYYMYIKFFNFCSMVNVYVVY